MTPSSHSADHSPVNSPRVKTLRLKTRLVVSSTERLPVVELLDQWFVEMFELVAFADKRNADATKTEADKICECIVIMLFYKDRIVVEEVPVDSRSTD